MGTLTFQQMLESCSSEELDLEDKENKYFTVETFTLLFFDSDFILVRCG